MVEGRVKRILNLLPEDNSRVANAYCLALCLKQTKSEGFAEKVFTDAENCMQSGNNKFENNHKLVSLAVNLFNEVYSDRIGSVLRFIRKIILSIKGCRDLYSMMSENLRLESSEKFGNIKNKLHVFCDCFEECSDALKWFNKQREQGRKTEERVENRLDDINCKAVGVEFSAKLKALVLEHKNVREEEILKSVGEHLIVYVRVAIMRYMMHILTLSTIPDEKMKSATEQIKMYMEEDNRRRVAFLTGILEPTHRNAIFLSSFSITEFPELDSFLKLKWSTPKEQSCLRGIKTYLTNKHIALHPIVFRDHWMNAASVKFIWSTSTAPHDDYAQFCFEPVSDGENIFFIRSIKRKSYIYMKTNSFLRKTSTRPREEGMFKVLHLQNDNCLISVLKYPGRFIYMEDNKFGRIRGAVTDNTYANGLPAKQHEWSLKEVCHRRKGSVINIVENPQMVSAFLSKTV